MHDEAGYRKTLRRIAGELVDSIAFTPPRPPPAAVCREISVASVGDRRIGFDATTVVRDADGALRRINISTQLMTLSRTELRGSDSYAITVSRKGIICEGLFVSSDGRDTFEWNLKLRRERGTTYVVDGTYERDRERIRANILGKRNAELRLTGYEPSIDPLAASVLVVRALADGTYEEAFEGLTSRIELDERGEVTRSRIQLGGNELDVRRIWSTGTCP